MSKRILAFVVAVLLGGVPVAGAIAAASDDGAPPYASIRSLQILQEQVAHGNGAAQAAQPKLMVHIAERFTDADPDAWKDPRNARAAIIFLLTGGNPSVIRSIMAKASMPLDLDRVLKGALAYAEGNDDVARDLLADIDPKTLPPMLGGQMALVVASLLPEKDEAKAVKLLDTARLMVPGTLVEEAALRRQMFMAAKSQNFDRFIFFSDQYIRRFRTSIYASSFKQHLMQVAKSLATSGDLEKLNKFDSVLAEYPSAEQIGFYLVMAKTAIVLGKADAARYAAEKAAALAGAEGGDGARSALYTGAALIVSDDAGKGVLALKSIDRSKLSPQDAELQDAALAVASGVRAEEPTPETAPDEAAKASPVEAASVAILEQARSALTDTDKLLGAPSP